MALRRYLSILFLMLIAVCCFAGETMPYYCKTTTTLNVRSGPGTGYSRIGQLPRGREVKVTERVNSQWVKIEYNGYQRGYVSSRYLVVVPKAESLIPDTDSIDSDKIVDALKGGGFSFWGIIWWLVKIFLALMLICILLQVLKVGARIVSTVFTIGFRIVSIPFFLLNSFQRYMAKPWFVWYKKNRHSDSTNAELRQFYQYLQIPFYILLFPVRFANACYFNMLTHCTFEMYNYIIEVFRPASKSEGRGDLGNWIVYLPLRIVKYPIWHGGLTIIESAIWTVIDTFVPALTLFHGTSCLAADSIVACSERGDRYGSNIGVWCVGAGNFAGNGIYFAPARSTAVHYSGGQSLIVCRVSLGRTIDLGLAPKYVYRECGHANAFNATRWGLNNGYVTGEWWRADAHWWEYCMYDWKNRYNYSWRIRPLYVYSLIDDHIMPIPGGMSHWLFREMVIDDLLS